LQVSDRLVSQAGKPYDPVSNKNVVLRASDGLLVFGYTGLAFIDGIPTDSWIADRVSGGFCASIGGALAYGDFPIRDVGSSLLAISQPLRDDPAFRKSGGEICAVGWQWDGKRNRSLARNVLWRLQPEGATLRWGQIVPRHIPERKKVFRMAPTGNWALGDHAWQTLLEQIGSAGADWESVEALLVNAIRSAAARSPGTIGPHCMSILLRPWLFPNAMVKFMPDSPHQGNVSGHEVEVSYSPWMIAPDAIHAPTVSVGGLNCEQGLLTYAMQMPQAPDSQRLKAAFQAQIRPTL
jgi:hypothetical protein